jgi:hypothetical protein
MQPVTTALKQCHTPAAHAASLHRCRPVRTCGEASRPEDPSSTQIRSVKKALIQHVVASLRARFDVTVSAPAKAAGLSDDEQAGSELASAVSAALHGADSMQAVRHSVQEGLEEAANALQSSGASGDDLNAAITALTTKLDDLLAAFAPTARISDTSDVVAAGARVVTKEKGVLEIRTQEGDVVKVKFVTRTAMRTGVAQVSDGDRTLSSTSLAIATHSRAQIFIEGDLNADELAAIADVVHKVDALANDFFAGNVDAALAKAVELDMDTMQLANVALRLSMRQRIDTHAVSVASPLQVAPPADAAATPDAAPAIEPDPAAAATESAVASAESNTATTADEMPVEAAPPVQPTGQEKSTASSPQTVIAKYVARVLGTLQSTGSSARVSLSFQMKLQLLTAAIESKQIDARPTAEAGLKKLCDIAEVAAAHA